MTNFKHKIIINVGRQIGSGGHIIAARLAERFGCRLLDRELLNLAAKESGFSEKFFEQNDEHKGFLSSLFHAHVPLVSDTNFHRNNFSEESLYQFQAGAIRHAASQGSCVIVGRTADYVLRNVPEAVSIFITADLADRLKRVMERSHLSEEAARKLIKEREASRSSYYNYYTGKQWGHGDSYDLVVNSSRLGIDGTVELIAKFIELRPHPLPLPEGKG